MLNTRFIRLIAAKQAMFFLCLAGAAWRTQGQPLQNALFTIGTTAPYAGGTAWAYVASQPTRPQSFAARTLAIYSKPGAPGTAGSYTLQGIAAVQTQPQVIQGLINRGVALGDDPVKLGARIDGLFAGLMPSTNLTLAQKISIVIQGSIKNPESFANLVFLGRLHPAMNLSLGLGWAQILTNGPLTTFEVRDYDLTNHADLGVLGRVTITNGLPIVLPAPGVPINVPERGGMGSLNARFRWATPPGLRQVSLLSAGFDLFRVPRVVAEASHYNTTPPTTAQLLGNPATVRVNTEPIFKNKDFNSDTDAADLSADPKTFFVADDNGLSQAKSPYAPVPFHNGDQFYYYVAARDLLGRDGALSSGVLVTICDRAPPNPPKLPKVANDYQYANGAEVQTLRVDWTAMTNLPPCASNSPPCKAISGYYVYRWDNPNEIPKFAGDPASHRISPLIPAIGGQTNYSFLDNGAGAPSTPADFGKTYWYTVRAVDDGACDGGNASPNSAAAFGVLRQRQGPAAPHGQVNPNCCEPLVYGYATDAVVSPDSEFGHSAVFILGCLRADAGIDWAEFYAVVGQGAPIYIGRFQFAPKSYLVSKTIILPISLFATNPPRSVFCQVGSGAGHKGYWAVTDSHALQGGSFSTFLFVSGDLCNSEFPSKGGNPLFRCGDHSPKPNLVGKAVQAVSPVPIAVNLTPGTKEYKIYRRVDFGPITLIKEGAGDYDATKQLSVSDPDLPANSATVCYYCQLFDENGNASPMTQIGQCIDIVTPPPQPLLSAIKTAGDVTNPQMTIEWFCPPTGIQRFEVLVSASSGVGLSSPAGSLGADAVPHPHNVPIDAAGTNFLDFAVYPTAQPGYGLAAGPQYSVQVPAAPGVEYSVQIRAVGAAGNEGPGSQFQTFRWAAAPAPDMGSTPWPARGIPRRVATTSSVIPFYLRSYHKGVLLQVGQVARAQLGPQISQLVGSLAQGVELKDIIATNAEGQPLLPFVVYRYQVTNEFFPVVSGSLVQVSPLIDSLAVLPATIKGGSGQSYQKVVDPFLTVLDIPAIGASQLNLKSPLLLKDTQPVLHRARYKYVFVQFGPDGEPVEVVPTRSVDILP